MLSNYYTVDYIIISCVNTVQNINFILWSKDTIYSKMSYSPFLTWIFYPLIGYSFATILIRCVNKNKFCFRLVCVSVLTESRFSYGKPNKLKGPNYPAARAFWNGKNIQISYFGLYSIFINDNMFSFKSACIIKSYWTSWKQTVVLRRNWFLVYRDDFRDISFYIF